MWFGYGNISFPLIKRIKARLPSLKVVCDTDSVWSRFILRELPFEKDPVKIYDIRNKGREKLQEEIEWVDLCDVTTAVSEVDADYYRKIATNPTKVKIFSNAIDLSFYSKAPPPPLGFCRPAVFLGGSFAPGSAMDKAARWVLKEIFPSLMKLIPGIHLYIVGRGSRETLREYDMRNGVTITGRVPSVLPYLCNSDVSIVPLQFESGTRFKILEAGACGIPSVSTTLGAEGLPVTHQKDILIADTATDFIQAVMGILTNAELSQKLSLNCRALVERKFGIESLAREASEIIEYLITPRRPAVGNL
jgi:glycosyltransferase involved in cell wall biosynthesis